MAQRSCDVCGGHYEAKLSSSRYCSARCRKRAFQDRRSSLTLLDGAPAPAAPDAGPVTRQVLDALTAVDRQSTPAGAVALNLAQVLDAGTTSPASVAKELRAAMAEATAGAAVEPDLLDELRERRERRFGGA